MPAGRPHLLAASLLIVAGVLIGQHAHAQTYPTMASQPDPSDFVGRADSRLTLLGTPFRFGGVNITWLGIRQDGGAPARRPTVFEVQDALQTARALGANVVRLPGLANTAGCDLCLQTAPGRLSDAAFAQVDLVLKMARDFGLKVILPLAAQEAAGLFTDGAPRAEFTARVQAIVSHRNSLTNTAYADDPTILAWENCDACGSSADPAAVAGWSEQLGRTIKAIDTHHLYADGAFAGRIGAHARSPVGADSYATPSVDIVGDDLALAGDPAAARTVIEQTAGGVIKSARVYVLDSFGWSPTLWKTNDDLVAWLATIARTRDVSGAIAGNLQGHADQGGYLPAQPATGPGLASLYFPGTPTPEMDLPTMQERGRALRRFDFAMADITYTPPYELPPPPEVLSAAHGRVVWRGSAGAATYTIERSPDPGEPWTWTTLCDACARDSAGFWQDPSPPQEGAAWYRVMPLNINGHRAEPSEAMQAK